MSRKRKQQKFNSVPNLHGGLNSDPKKIVRTTHVKLEEWEKFERFKKDFPKIVECIEALETNWTALSQYFDQEFKYWDSDFSNEIPEQINELKDAIVGIAIPPQKHLSPRKIGFANGSKIEDFLSSPSKKNKKKKTLMYAEVIIEDISDGKI